MDNHITKLDDATIYEIHQSCRLCGAGAGYKIPIIEHNLVINLDPDLRDETELMYKIRECVQIEVHQNDKMPSLICELCVDKVNDFYKFLQMCKRTNQKTRVLLGLPPQTLPSGAVNPKFGIKEEPKTPKLSEGVKITRSVQSNELITARVLAEPSSLRSGRNRQPSPRRSPRGTESPCEEEAPVTKVQPDDLLEPRKKRPRYCMCETIETPKEVNKKAN